MGKILEIIRRKPPLFLGISLGFLLLLCILKWQLYPPVSALWFLLGGIIGVYLLDGAEVFFALSPSPFRTPLFMWAFAVVALFIITSSGSFLASGLVFSLYLTLVLRQYGEIQGGAGYKGMFLMFIGLMLLETILFIAWA